MARGWIRVDRRLLEHWLWQDKPFSRGQAWVDLLLLVNHEPKKIPFEGDAVEVQRGQTITSIRKLADRWGWSVGKVGRFLTVLESEQMLTKKRYANGTVISLVNYGLYQITRTESGTPAEHARNTDGTPTETNKNDITIYNNDKQTNYARARKLPDGFSDWESYWAHVAELKK